MRGLAKALPDFDRIAPRSFTVAPMPPGWSADLQGQRQRGFDRLRKVFVARGGLGRAEQLARRSNLRVPASRAWTRARLLANMQRGPEATPSLSGARGVEPSSRRGADVARSRPDGRRRGAWPEGHGFGPLWTAGHLADAPGPFVRVVCAGARSTVSRQLARPEVAEGPARSDAPLGELDRAPVTAMPSRVGGIVDHVFGDGAPDAPSAELRGLGQLPGVSQCRSPVDRQGLGSAVAGPARRARRAAGGPGCRCAACRLL